MARILEPDICVSQPALVKGYLEWKQRRRDHAQCCRMFNVCGSTQSLETKLCAGHRIASSPIVSSSVATTKLTSEIRFRYRARWGNSSVLLGSKDEKTRPPQIVAINWTNEQVVGIGWTGQAPRNSPDVDRDELDLFWHTNLGWSLEPSMPMNDNWSGCGLLTHNVAFLSNQREECCRHVFRELIHAPVRSSTSWSQIRIALRSLVSIMFISPRDWHVILSLGRLERLGFDPIGLAQLVYAELLQTIQKSHKSVVIEFLFPPESKSSWHTPFRNTLIRSAHLHSLLIKKQK